MGEITWTDATSASSKSVVTSTAIDTGIAPPDESAAALPSPFVPPGRHATALQPVNHVDVKQRAISTWITWSGSAGLNALLDGLIGLSAVEHDAGELI